jgi:hypothetical protein
MIITEPMPFRSLRVLMASIQTHEELLKQTWDGSEEHWRIQRTLAALGRQLDEAEQVWKAHHAKA